MKYFWENFHVVLELNLAKRMVWIGRNLKARPVPPLATSTRPGFSKPYPAWPWYLHFQCQFNPLQMTRAESWECLRDLWDTLACASPVRTGCCCSLCHGWSTIYWLTSKMGKVLEKRHQALRQKAELYLVSFLTCALLQAASWRKWWPMHTLKMSTRQISRESQNLPRAFFLKCLEN